MGKNKRRHFAKAHAEEIEQLNDDFYECLSLFIDDLRFKKRSSYTIDYYDRELRYFARILEKQALSTNLNKITSDIIRYDYVAYREVKDGVQHATINSGLRALRAFFNWAEGKYVKTNPMKEIVISEAKPREIETFDRQQIYDLLSQPDPKLFVGLRDIAIMVFMLDTGVRVRELCDITVDDIRWEDGQVLVHGKNGEDRLVPIEAQTKQVLKRYVDARGYSAVDWLFITVDDTKMSRDSVRRRIEKYGRMANIKNVRCSPHTFRHTFAKMSVQNGANLFDLQKILGHKSLDMVRRYVNLFSSDTKKAHRRFSPINNLNIRF